MRLFLMAAALVAASSTQATAQGLVTQKALSYEMAQAIVQGTVERCRADGFSVSVSVIDVSGLLKAFARDDGNNGPHTIDLSRRKAYTALTFASRWATSLEAAKAIRAGNTKSLIVSVTMQQTSFDPAISFTRDRFTFRKPA
jgi:uncharacterized protein GlcG (DUF336 family)